MKLFELRPDEQLLLKENIIDDFTKKEIILTNNRIVFLDKNKIENELQLEDIVETYPLTNVYTDQCELRIELNNEKTIAVRWYGKSFLHRTFDNNAREYARTNTERWMDKINKLKNSYSSPEKEDPIKILKIRLAKGEISEIEYIAMKKVLEKP